MRVEVASALPRHTLFRDDDRLHGSRMLCPQSHAPRQFDFLASSRRVDSSHAQVDFPCYRRRSLVGYDAGRRRRRSCRKF